MATAPLLNITTLLPQDSVLIDGVSYFIRNRESLTIRGSMIVERAFPRLIALMASDELTDEQDAEATALLQQTVSVVLDAPADVIAKLTDTQRLNVFMAFTPLRSKLWPSTNGAKDGAAATTKPRTSASGSRASKRATAAHRKTGSTT